VHHLSWNLLLQVLCGNKDTVQVESALAGAVVPELALKIMLEPYEANYGAVRKRKLETSRKDITSYSEDVGRGVEKDVGSTAGCRAQAQRA